MAFKRGLIVGFGVGYVLGARAGRERYQQIVTWWHRFTGNPCSQRSSAPRMGTLKSSSFAIT